MTQLQFRCSCLVYYTALTTSVPLKEDEYDVSELTEALLLVKVSGPIQRSSEPAAAVVTDETISG